jgi:hypothetical protein
MMLTRLRPQAAPATLASLTVMVTLAVAGVIALDIGRAQASHVSCGDTITADTTLDSDLVDCPNNGIVIGADDITLDLNGHMIERRIGARIRSRRVGAEGTAQPSARPLLVEERLLRVRGCRIGPEPRSR